MQQCHPVAPAAAAAGVGSDLRIIRAGKFTSCVLHPRLISLHCAKWHDSLAENIYCSTWVPGRGPCLEVVVRQQQSA